MMTQRDPVSGETDPGRWLWSRLLDRDTSLWSNDPAVCSSISQHLGWLDAVSFSRGQLPRIRAFTDDIKAAGFDRVILLGMGGSSLAPEVFNRCFQHTPGRPDLIVLDTTFPDSVAHAGDTAARGKPLFIVSSKSGSTAETAALYKYFQQWSRSRYGDNSGDHFVAITDEHSALHTLAANDGFREVFLNPADIGGRYSALSLFGLVPAGLIGVDLARLLERAQRVFDNQEAPNSALDLGLLMGRAALAGRDKLTLTFSPKLEPLGPWIEQLVGESTGKDGKGIVPVVGEKGLSAELYPDDRIFVDIALSVDAGEGADRAKRLNQLKQNGHPVAALRVDDVDDVGAEFLRWQMATAIAASVMGVNPFDQPDVNATKQATSQILRQSPQTDIKAAPRHAVDPSSFRVFLNDVQAHDYFTLLAYLPSHQGWEGKLQPLRDRLLQQLNVATCVALGPGYLHSTGQLHKGGKNNGHFVVLTATLDNDVAVPSEQYTFGHLIDAQARGDLEILRQRGQKVCHIDLGTLDTAASNIEQLTEAIG
jgi:transaldolase/glucose-6-phosphate isomerase